MGYGFVGIILKFNNNTLNSTDSFCGMNNCPSTILHGSKPTLESFQLFYITLILCCILSIIITYTYLENITYDDQDYEITCFGIGKVILFKYLLKFDINKTFIEFRFRQELINLLNLYSNLDVWLLFPITFFTGYEMTFIWFEYSRV